MKKHVTDLLSDEEIRQLTVGHPLCITTPPDSGKTSFVIHNICKFARSQDMRVVLCVNRKALRMETTNRMYEEELQQFITDNHLIILSLQALEGLGEQADKLRKSVRRSDVICVDEAHYFVEDSLFNPQTEKSFDFLTAQIRDHIMIFMTATPKDFIRALENRFSEFYKEDRKRYNEALSCYEEVFDCKRCELYEDENGEPPDGDSLELYLNDDKVRDALIMENWLPPEEPQRMSLQLIDGIKPDYSYLDIRHFHNLMDLVPSIINSKDRWLIFVDSKKIARNLKEQLVEGFKKADRKVRVGFVDTDYEQIVESQQIVDAITRDGQLVVDVLISTSTLDNGINITDDKLCNIVVTAVGETQFIQMVNRKRVRGTERVTLFLQVGSAGFFSRRKADLLLAYESARQLANDGYYTSPDRILQYKNYEDLRGIMLYRADSARWKLSRLSLLKLQLQFNFYNETLSDLEVDSNAFLKRQYAWLGLDWDDDEAERRDISFDEKNVSQVLEILTNFQRREPPVCDGEEFKKLANTILELLGETGNEKPLTKLNQTLLAYGDLKMYRFTSFPAREVGTFYVLGELSYPHLKSGLDVGAIRRELGETKKFADVFRLIFDGECPEFFCQSDEWAQNYLKLCLKHENADFYFQKNRSGQIELREG